MPKMFKSSKPIKNCLLLEYNTQKDLALSFCRVEEYYEGNPKINGEILSLEEFIDHFMDKNGKINYFEYWSGFNIPGYAFTQWFGTKASDKTKWELALADEVAKKLDMTKPFYIIGGKKGDMNVIDHEIAHALYYMNENYKSFMLDVIYKFYQWDRKNYVKMVKKLKKMGYGENVIKDEIQAYMSTSTKKELVEKFELDYKSALPSIKLFRKVLDNYNTYKK